MNNSLSWKLFREEQKAKLGDNVLLSPWSIQTALHMALNGAKGNTLSEFLDLLDCQNCTVNSINEEQAKMTLLLEEQSGHPELTTANGFFMIPTA